MKRKRKDHSIRLPEPEFLPAEVGKGSWKDHFIKQVYFLCLLGATDTQISQVFGVCQQAVDYWKKTKPEFKQAMDKGKMIADAKVSHSLYLAAIGYSHPDTVILTNRVKKFNEKGKVIKEWTEPLIVPTTKCYPPNVQAAIKWLSARQPAVWGNKIEVKGKFSVQHNLDLSQFNNEELETLVKFGIVEDVNYEQ